jgi:hypothetical protein
MAPGSKQKVIQRNGQKIVNYEVLSEFFKSLCIYQKKRMLTYSLIAFTFRDHNLNIAKNRGLDFVVF